MPDRVLPTYSINGHEFYVDLEREEFRELGNEANLIPFACLRVHPHGYLLPFDRNTKRAWDGQKGKEPEHVELVFVPFKSKLDPIGMARQQGFPDDYYTR